MVVRLSLGRASYATNETSAISESGRITTPIKRAWTGFFAI
jgi:hypothetical protein